MNNLHLHIMAVLVDIIIVNWNSGIATCNAIEKYLNQSSEKLICKIFVVDNGSDDNSLELLSTKDITSIPCKKNIGFSKACNLAYQLCTGDYILLLNPDTESSPENLLPLVEFLETHQDYAITGPAQLDSTGVLLRTCGRFINFYNALSEVIGLSKLFPKLFVSAPIMKDWEHDTSRQVDHVMGSYMLIKRNVIKQVGFMDEGYFVYLEDLDLSKRVHQAGYKSFYNHEVAIMHVGGGTGNKDSDKRLLYYLNSRRYYWRKHLGKFQAVILISISFIIEPFLRCLDALIKNGRPTIKEILWAYIHYIKGAL